MYRNFKVWFSTHFVRSNDKMLVFERAKRVEKPNLIGRSKDLRYEILLTVFVMICNIKQVQIIRKSEYQMEDIRYQNIRFTHRRINWYLAIYSSDILHLMF